MSFTDGGFTKFRNHAVGWCLDAHVPIPNLNGAPVILWDCSATFSDDRWSLTLGLGFGTIQSRAWNSTGYCLTVPGGRTSPGSGHSYSPATATPPSQVVLATLVSA
jgi:hypothetical protein